MGERGIFHSQWWKWSDEFCNLCYQKILQRMQNKVFWSQFALLVVFLLRHNLLKGHDKYLIWNNKITSQTKQVWIVLSFIKTQPYENLKYVLLLWGIYMIIKHTQVLLGGIWITFYGYILTWNWKRQGNSYVKNYHDYLTARKLNGIICWELKYYPSEFLFQHDFWSLEDHRQIMFYWLYLWLIERIPF